MQHLRAADLDTLLSAQSQSKPEIDVFQVTEEALVEAAQGIESRLCVERCRCARRKDQAVLIWKRGRRRTSAASPRCPVNAERIAEAVDDGRILRIELRRAERFGPRISLGCRAQLGEPVRPGKGVRIKRRNPLGRASTRAEIVCRGKADIGSGMTEVEPGIGKLRRCDWRRGRSVVDNDSLEGGHRLCRQRVQTGLEQGAPIIVDDNDANPGRVGCGGINHETILVR